LDKSAHVLNGVGKPQTPASLLCNRLMYLEFSFVNNPWNSEVAHPFAAAALGTQPRVKPELQNFRPSTFSLQASGLELESVVECLDALRANTDPNTGPNRVKFSLLGINGWSASVQLES
jgi:hypothetical protein